MGIPSNLPYEHLRPPLEITAQFAAHLGVKFVAAQDIMQLRLTLVQVYAGVYAPVVAAGRARAHIIGFVDEQDGDVETAEFARDCAARDTSAHHQHIGTGAFQRVVGERGRLDLLGKAFEADVVEHAERTLGHCGDAATVNLVPAVELPRQPDATAVFLHGDLGRDSQHLIPHRFQIHRATSCSLSCPHWCGEVHAYR